MSDDSFEIDANGLLLQWLAAHGPAEWHRVAMTYNWDGSYEPLNWIVDQDGCDAATAQTIFWLGSPDYFLDFRDRADAELKASINIENFDLLAKIASNWNAGKYRNKKFWTDPADMTGMVRAYRAKEQALGGHNLPWRIDASMFVPCNGQRLDASDYAEGFPPELRRVIWPAEQV